MSNNPIADARQAEVREISRRAHEMRLAARREMARLERMRERWER